MTVVKVDGARLWGTVEAIAAIGPLPAGGSRRLALSDEDRQARGLFAHWCREAGCRVEIDRFGNIFGIREGRHPDAGVVLTGSHLDTQPHGGRFDGIYGVLAGLEVIRALNDHDISTDRPVVVVNWTNEEGVRFSPGLTGSQGFTGQVSHDALVGLRDADGMSFADALAATGYDGTSPGLRVAAYLEAHIEQGPILEAAGLAVGIVTGVQGVRWFELTIEGADRHAGTTPMTGRADGFMAAARMGLALRSALLAISPDVRFTIGRVAIEPGSVNTVPGLARLSIDLRHPDTVVLDEMEEAIRMIAAREAAAERCAAQVRRQFDLPPIRFDADLLSRIHATADEAGIAVMPIVSGAMHDACALAAIAPTAMIFVPCRDGISHHEAEWAEPAHLAAGTQVLLGAVLSAAAVVDPASSGV